MPEKQQRLDGPKQRKSIEAYRAVYAVKFAGRVYVLKSRSGTATPKAELNPIKARLKRAEEEHAAWLDRQKGGKENG